MSSKPDLLVAPCSYDAARYAVMRWHYSRTMPVGKLVKVGAWEGGNFIGAIVYGRGANNHIGNPYGLIQTEVCELVRVALSKHIAPVSRIVSLASRVLASVSPGLRLIVSYADPRQGHVGAIYQAMNWVYVGFSVPQRFALGDAGEIVHKRSAFSKFGTVSGQTYSDVFWKHKYLYPLDKAMRKQIAPLAQPYPKKAMRPVIGDNIAASDAGRFDSEPGALG